jgi:hypothetical protein
MVAEGFESGITHLNTTTGGTGAAAASDATYFKNGAKSVKLTGGSDGALCAIIELWTPYPPLSKLGAEVSFAFTVFDDFRLTARVHDGTNYHAGNLRYDHTNSRFQYYDGAAWQTLVTRALRINLGLWHTMKLVIDPAKNKYVRAILDYEQFDLSDKSLFSAANAESPYFISMATVMSRAGFNDIAYADNMILTRDEP